MRINIRYFKPMVYGNFTTLTFDDVNPEEMLVVNLKRKIFMKLRLEPQN
jgi:hypothetical protein